MKKLRNRFWVSTIQRISVGEKLFNTKYTFKVGVVHGIVK